MANEVQIFLDKDSGQLKAKPNAGGGGGGNALGYTHDQVVPALVWSVIHGLNTTNILYQIFDSTGESLIPDRFKVIDANSVEVDFSVVQNGKLQIISF